MFRAYDIVPPIGASPTTSWNLRFQLKTNADSVLLSLGSGLFLSRAFLLLALLAAGAWRLDLGDLGIVDVPIVIRIITGKLALGLGRKRRAYRRDFVAVNRAVLVRIELR